MILVDTSVWIGMFRANKPLDLERLVEFADVVTCPPLVPEVLQGIRDESAFRMARDAMLAMPMVESPMHIGVWLEAAQLYRTARSAGVTVRSGVDCAIAVCALRNNLLVLHRNRDFAQLAKVVPLRHRQV
jgi:predicted nucleic acid-binding protein